MGLHSYMTSKLILAIKKPSLNINEGYKNALKKNYSFVSVVVVSPPFNAVRILSVRFNSSLP